MVTRTLIQKKVFDIRCMSECLCGHGFSWDKKGIDFIKEQEWQSDEECNKLLQHYTQEWKNMYEKAPHTTTSCAPEISIYWKTIKNF